MVHVAGIEGNDREKLAQQYLLAVGARTVSDVLETAPELTGLSDQVTLAWEAWRLANLAKSNSASTTLREASSTLVPQLNANVDLLTAFLSSPEFRSFWAALYDAERKRCRRLTWIRDWSNAALTALPLASFATWAVARFPQALVPILFASFGLLGSLFISLIGPVGRIARLFNFALATITFGLVIGSTTLWALPLIPLRFPSAFAFFSLGLWLPDTIRAIAKLTSISPRSAREE